MKTKFSVAVDCFLPGRVRTYLHPCNCMTNTYCCVYSVETPDDGQYVCPKHIEFCTKINLRNSASCWLLLLEYIYNYARSCECQICAEVFSVFISYSQNMRYSSSESLFITSTQILSLILKLKVQKHAFFFVWMFNIFRILSLILNSFMRDLRCCLWHFN